MMRVVLFCHSLRLRLEPRQRPFPARRRARAAARAATTSGVFEPADGWSRDNLVADQGAAALDALARGLSRTCASERYDRPTLDLDAALDGADLVLVHEWNEPELVAAHRPAPRGAAAASRCCSTTRTTARSPTRRRSRALRPRRLRRRAGLRRGAARASTSRAAGRGASGPGTRRPTRALFRPLPRDERRGDLVWVGNWGDDERTRRARRLPARAGRATSACAPRVHGVRYPEDALARARRGRHRTTRGWLPNYRVPRGLRPPPRHGARAAPALCRGAARHPDHPRLRGAGLRHPAGLGAVARRGGPVPRRATTTSSPRDGDGDAAAPAPRCWPTRPARAACARHGLAHDPRAPHLRAPGRRAARDHRRSSARRSRRRSAMAAPHARSPSSARAWSRPTGTAPRPTTAASFAALAARGHRITFYEPDAYDRQQHRDIADPPGRGSWSMPATDDGAARARSSAARGADRGRQGERRRRLRRAARGGGPRARAARRARSRSGTSMRPATLDRDRAATRPTRSAR